MIRTRDLQVFLRKLSLLLLSFLLIFTSQPIYSAAATAEGWEVISSDSEREINYEELKALGPKLEKWNQQAFRNLSALTQQFATDFNSPHATPQVEATLNWLNNIENLDRIGLREKVMELTGGKGIVLRVTAHKSESRKFNYLNKMMKAEGFDYLHFEPQFIEGLTDIDLPSPGDKDLFKAWQKWRAILYSSIGVTGIVLNLTFGNAPNGLYNDIMGHIMMGLMVAGLESQFSHFNAFWNKYFFSKAYPFKIKLYQFNEIIKQDIEHKRQALEAFYVNLRKLANITLKGAYNTAYYTGVIPVINQLTRFVPVTQATVYQVMTNFSIQFGLSLAVAANYSMLGMNPPFESFTDVVINAVIFSALFDATAGVIQQLLGRWQATGRISESLRFRLETILMFYANITRFLSVIPGTRGIAFGMFGLLAIVELIPITYTGMERGGWLRKALGRFVSNYDESRNAEKVSPPVDVIPGGSSPFALAPALQARRCAQAFGPINIANTPTAIHAVPYFKTLFSGLRNR